MHCWPHLALLEEEPIAVNGPVLIGKATFRLTSHKIPIARADLWRAIRIGFSLYRFGGHFLRFRALILVVIVLTVGGFPLASFPWLDHRIGFLRASRSGRWTSRRAPPSALRNPSKRARVPQPSRLQEMGRTVAPARRRWGCSEPVPLTFALLSVMGPGSSWPALREVSYMFY
jgi:hypothetical protein